MTVLDIVDTLPWSPKYEVFITCGDKRKVSLRTRSDEAAGLLRRLFPPILGGKRANPERAGEANAR